MAITRDRERFATLRASTVKIWDARTRQLFKTLEMPRSAGDSPFGGALAFSRDGRLIAASDSGLDTKGTSYLYVQTVVWDMETGKQLFVLKDQKFDVDALQFTRDSHSLLTGSVDATIDLWDTATGRLTRTISLTGQ